MTEPSKLLSLPLACQRTGVTYWQAYKAILTGGVPSIRRGGRWYVAEGNLELIRRAADA